MNLCTTIAINNATVAAAAAAVCAHKPEDKDEEVEASPLFELLAVFLVFVVLPAIIFGIICLICKLT